MILLEFSTAELQLMRTLLAQYDEIVHGENDPVLARLFPVAYRDDPDAAAEFARYTRSGLVETKSSRAGVIAAAVASDEAALVLSDEDAAAWLPVLTDLRLIVAERLGIVRDEDEVPDDPLGEVYHWLGQLQSYLIDALDALT
ncbi:MAG TPA: DUF2017 family protein [Pseudolysinimonas sp.]|nr:DUF2017 family protein [Pseudolysinimonas sp.]